MFEIGNRVRIVKADPFFKDEDIVNLEATIINSTIKSNWQDGLDRIAIYIDEPTDMAALWIATECLELLEEEIQIEVESDK